MLILDLLFNCKPTRSAPKMLSIKGDYTFRFSNFLIISLHNSSANSWLGIISLLAAPTDVLLSRPQDLFDIYHILDF